MDTSAAIHDIADELPLLLRRMELATVATSRSSFLEELELIQGSFEHIQTHAAEAIEELEKAFSQFY